jgi:hypothetical protein
VDRRGGGEGFEFPPERGFFARIAADIEYVHKDPGLRLRSVPDAGRQGAVIL